MIARQAANFREERKTRFNPQRLKEKHIYTPESTRERMRLMNHIEASQIVRSTKFSKGIKAQIVINQSPNTNNKERQ
ncbi:hypothetical protein DXC90_05560 [Collinsella sp. TF09-1AT]|nr:hypothetical protein DXC90_05560 [Collinsella sp. TF09-1AT]